MHLNFGDGSIVVDRLSQALLQSCGWLIAQQFASLRNVGQAFADVTDTRRLEVGIYWNTQILRQQFEQLQQGSAPAIGQIHDLATMPSTSPANKLPCDIPYERKVAGTDHRHVDDRPLFAKQAGHEQRNHAE